MSVVDWKEIHDGRDGESDSGKRRAVRRYTRVFRAQTSSNYDDATVVKSYGSCPRVGNQHPRDIGAWCRKVTARNESFSKRVWLVTALYSSEFELADNPLADPTQIEWEATTFQRPYVKDTEGKAILNSAGSYPDPPLEGDDARWIVTVRKNVDRVPTWILTYKNTVNSAAFTLDGVQIAARQSKLSAIRLSTWQERNDIRYRVISFSFQLADHGETWDKVWLDYGPYEIDPNDSTKRRRCKDKDGVYGPAPLDGSGHQLANPTPDNAAYITDRIYKEANHGLLPLT